jgi:hypothetical protein
MKCNIVVGIEPNGPAEFHPLERLLDERYFIIESRPNDGPDRRDFDYLAPPQKLFQFQT